MPRTDANRRGGDAAARQRHSRNDAALSECGIRALILPPEATHIILCADHDANGVGQRATDDTAARWLAEGRDVRIALPPEPDTDFADGIGFSSTAEAQHVA
jgi:phage/plasmid primase-like uncharacterized protein